MDNNKEITIEDLARMVQEGFNETAKKEDIEKLQKDVTDISHKVTQIDRRLFSLEEDIYVTKKKKFEDLEGRVSFVERKLGVEAAIS